MTTINLKEKVARTAEDPGVYLMKNEAGQVIYVGKAKNLKNRLRTYFNAQADSQFKTKKLVAQIKDFDVVIVHNELEALLTERSLIRTHDPKYNILLRDDKEYPFIRIDYNEPWPRIEKVRQRKDDGAAYIGPFGSASSLSLSIKSIGHVFPLIRCSRHEFRNAKRPCNYYHMKMCLAPCALEIERQDYIDMVKGAEKVLRGKNRSCISALKKRMDLASTAQRYELAAQFRDQISALEKIAEKQAVVVKNVVDTDILAITTKEDFVGIHVLVIRDGRLVGSDHFSLQRDVPDTTDALSSFSVQYYDNRFMPECLILANDSVDVETYSVEMNAFFAHQCGSDKLKLTVRLPKNDDERDLAETARKNARYQLHENIHRNQTKSVNTEVLKDLLALEARPRRIECIDISNTGDDSIVASNVVFIEGRPAKDFYRIYNIKTVVDGPDDFESMREVVERRLERGMRDDDLPDLLVIDGGKGQLSAALESASKFPNLALPIVSLAKAKVKDKGNITPVHSDERVFIPGREHAIPLAVGSPAFRLLTHIRDEAHRFAITRHRKKRQKKSESSSMESIPGIGPKMRQKLLLKFGSLENIQNASLEQLLEVKGLGEASAVQLHALFRSVP